MHRSRPAIRFLTTACVMALLSACGETPAPTGPSRPADTADKARTGPATGDETHPGEFQMGIQTEPFGKTKDGQQIDRYTPVRIERSGGGIVGE